MKVSKSFKKVFFGFGSGAILFLYFSALSYWGKQNKTDNGDSGFLNENDTSLVDGWKFHAGDDAQWASTAFNDSSWMEVSTDSLPASYKGEVAWFRLHLKVDSSFLKAPASLSIRHFGASEIYLNGFCIARFGEVARDGKEENMNPEVFPVNIQLNGNVSHLIAIRYSNLHIEDYRKRYGANLAGFQLRLQDEPALMRETFSGRYAILASCSIGIFLLTLAFVHFLLYLFYRKAKENLYYSIFAFGYSMIFFIGMIQAGALVTPWIELAANTLVQIIFPLLLLALLQFVHRVYNSEFPKWLWVAAISISVLIAFDGITNMINPTVVFSCMVWLVLFCVIAMLRGTYKAIKENIPGARILGVGMGIFSLFIFLILSMTFYSNNINLNSLPVLVGAFAAMLSIPISMSIYLAYSVSATNKDLSMQKETLEIRVKERTSEVVRQKKVIEEKNKDITDSINYAKRIQDAILPSDEQVKRMLPDSFVLFKPKDIVSGDFYFFAESGERVIAAAVDCTGHGVPGAFMSMVGYNHLKRIVNEERITDTSKILDELHKQVLYSLNRDISKRDSKDGMDVSILSINTQKREVQFSGAVRPLYYFNSSGFQEVKGERYSIAGVKEIGSASYASTAITVTEPTTFYLFSDGFVDQFGGKDGKKVMSKNFRELLASIQMKSMQEQKEFLGNFIEEWKGGREQMDDIMVIGIKIS